MNMKIIGAFFALALSASSAVAQSQPNPPWFQGYVPTPGQWNAMWASKQDYLNAQPCLVTGCFMTGSITISKNGAGNTLVLFGNSTGLPPGVQAGGSDTNTNLNLGAKGTGAVALIAQTKVAFSASNPDTSAVNWVTTQGADTGNAPLIGTGGSDTNIDLAITPQGSGKVTFGNAASFTANGSVATTITSLGPAGSHTTIQEWLTVKDSGGTVRYIPAY